MPRRKDLTYWTARIRRLADLEGDLHVGDATDVVESISEIYGDLYHLVADGADAYFQTTYSITADGSASYREPDDHLSTVMFERVDNGRRYPLRRLEAQERHMFNDTSTGEGCAYALIDNAIVLYPKPASGTYELLYIPQPPDITSYSGTDLIDVVNIYGEVFLIHGAASILLAKSEADVRFHLSRQARAEEKLMEWAAQRSFHDAHTQTIGDDVLGPPRRRRAGNWPMENP